MSYSDSFDFEGFYAEYSSITWDDGYGDRFYDDFQNDKADREYEEREDQRAWDLLDKAYEREQLEALEELIEPAMPSHSGITNQRLPEIMMQVAGWEVGILFGPPWNRGHRKGFKEKTLRSHRPYQHGWYRRKGDDLGMYFSQTYRRNK